MAETTSAAPEPTSGLLYPPIAEAGDGGSSRAALRLSSFLEPREPPPTPAPASCFPALTSLLASHRVLLDVEREDLSTTRFAESAGRYFEYAAASSEETAEGVCRAARLPADSLLVTHLAADYFRPAYYLAVDHDTEHIILAIRGTKRLPDVWTDVGWNPVEFMGGHAHDGFVRASTFFSDAKPAEYVDDDVLTLVSRLKLAHPTYTVRVVGHSLGGGVASLLAIANQNGTNSQRAQRDQ
eukprot:m51a1_g5775 hypothetical protein (240) ;mRNA; f:1251950-1252788